MLRKKYSHKIYIDNSGFNNRGDQLMIQAIWEQIRKYYPNALLLLKQSAFEQNPTYCIEHHIYPLSLSNNIIKKSWLYKKLTNLLLRDEWINTPEDVDIILDSRGYHLADWRINNQEYVDFLSRYYKRFNKKGRKFIVLPQAIGPFGNVYSRQAMALVHEQAEFIYAREQVSYDYLKNMYPESDKIGICPDFTCLTSKMERRSIVLPTKQYVIIIPNSKMKEQTSNSIAGGYMKFLSDISQYLQDIGENVVLLNHEGIADEELLLTINGNLKHRCLILSNLSGMEIKSIIAEAKLVITGRFHGAVSGLTQGVPTLCTAWSHKYIELLKEHECSNNILNVDDIKAAYSIINSALNHPEEYSSKKGCNEKISEQVNNMWNSVMAILSKKS